MKKKERKNKSLIYKDYSFDYQINIEELNTNILNHSIFLVDFFQKVIYWLFLLKRSKFKFQFKNILKKRNKRTINNHKQEIKKDLGSNDYSNVIIEDQKISKIDEFKTEEEYSIYLSKKDVNIVNHNFNLDKKSKRNIELTLIVKRKRIKERKIEKIKIQQLIDSLAVKIKEKREKLLKFI